MRGVFIILVSLFVTALNVNCYGKLSNKKLEKIKTETKREFKIKNSKNLKFSFAFFKLVNFS